MGTKLLVLHFQRFCCLPKERNNQRFRGCWWTRLAAQRMKFYSRDGSIGTCLHAQHTKRERDGHGPTECHSILSYMVASHGVPRLQTSLFCFDYIWFALYRDVHYCCPSWMMHRFLPGFGSSLLVLAQPYWVLESYRHLATVFRRKGRSNTPFQKFTWTSFPKFFYSCNFRSWITAGMILYSEARCSSIYLWMILYSEARCSSIYLCRSRLAA